MKFLLVAWTAWSCPGGLFGSLWPVQLRPLVCRPAPRLELYDPARAAAARRRVSELGPDASLSYCRGLRPCAVLSSWSEDVHFQEVPQ